MREDTLFCINLEVVILEVKIQRLFFGRSYGSTILFRDKLTFRKCPHKTPFQHTKIEGFASDTRPLDPPAPPPVWLPPVLKSVNFGTFTCLPNAEFY